MQNILLWNCMHGSAYSPLAFVGLFVTIRLQVTTHKKSVGKESNFLSISYEIHSPLPIQKVTACSRHLSKGFTWWGVTFPFQPRTLRATLFYFFHVIKALSSLRRGPSALSSSLWQLIPCSNSVLLLSFYQL